MMDEQGKVWFTARLRPPANPDYCKQGSSLPSAKVAPQATSLRQLSRFDSATGKWDLINTCFTTHHLNFAEDADNTLWLSNNTGLGGAPVPKLATAIRSAGESRSMNALAARAMPSAPPNRMFGSSTAMTMRRPPVTFSLVVNPSGGGAAAGVEPAGVMSEIHSALITRRVLPSMRTLKSAGVSVLTG